MLTAHVISPQLLVNGYLQVKIKWLLYISRRHICTHS